MKMLLNNCLSGLMSGRRRFLLGALTTAGILGAGLGIVAPAAAQPVTKASLPRWAIGPFVRYQGNPILTAPVVPTASTSWEWPRTFNPGVVVVNGTFHMLYRGSTQSNFSEIGAATSTDGLHWTQYAGNPVISRTLSNETQGTEDPRLYYQNGTYYAFFTGYNGSTVDINEAVSTDAIHWTQLGPVIDGNKDAAVVANPQGMPVKINGVYMMYYGQSSPGTFLAKSPDLTHWTTVGPVNMHFPQSYSPFELCVAVTGYPTTAKGPINHNIDLFVAGELMGQDHWFYGVSETEFSGTDPAQELAQMQTAVLSPQAPYEVYGYTPHTVFMNTILFYENHWWLYYGAGDTVSALATAGLRH